MTSGAHHHDKHLALSRELRLLLLDQASRTPAMGVQDYVKLLYQSEFGGGHLIDDPAHSFDRLLTEARRLNQTHQTADILTPPLIEPIGNGLARLHLQGLLGRTKPSDSLTTPARLSSDGDPQTPSAHTGEPARPSPDQQCCLRTLNRLFVATANTHQGSLDAFRDRLDVLQLASDNGWIPLDSDDVHAWLDDYARRGWPMLSHSEPYRQMYHPAYRVITLDQARFFDLFCQIERLMQQKDQVIIAIDGSSGTGKSTLAAQIASVYDAAVYHMDDYFLRSEQRTPERFAEPGGNVDRERFKTEVLNPVLAGRPFTYQPFDCQTMTIGEPVNARPARLTIIEGVYSLHPELREAYDWKICLCIDRDDQLRRILRRGGERMLERFKTEWIPLEDHYLNTLDIASISDQVIHIEIETTDPAETTDTTETTEPVETTDPTETTEPVETTDPAETTDPIQPLMQS